MKCEKRTPATVSARVGVENDPNEFRRAFGTETVILLIFPRNPTADVSPAGPYSFGSRRPLSRRAQVLYFGVCRISGSTISGSVRLVGRPGETSCAPRRLRLPSVRTRRCWHAFASASPKWIRRRKPIEFVEIETGHRVCQGGRRGPVTGDGGDNAIAVRHRRSRPESFFAVCGDGCSNFRGPRPMPPFFSRCRAAGRGRIARAALPPSLQRRSVHSTRYRNAGMRFILLSQYGDIQRRQYPL